MPRLDLFSIAALAALLTVPVNGAALAIDRVEVGFDGVYRDGQWTPLRVEITGAVPETVVIETVTSDADGTTVVQVSEPVPLKRQGSTAVAQTIFQSGRAESGLTVRLKDTEGQLHAEQRIAANSVTLPAGLPKEAVLWVTAGEPDRDRGEDTALPVPDGVTSASLTGALPGDLRAYAAADLLILRGDAAPTAEQAEAIRRWVAGGGRLAVALGRFTEAFRNRPLARWIPIVAGESIQLRDVSALENFPRRARLRIARLEGADDVFPAGSTTPLVAHAPYGFGRVTLFAMDLDTQPFSTWAGLPDLIRRSLPSGDRGANQGRRIASSGVTDLATQLIRAEETFPGVERSSVGATMLWLLLLAVIVGPLDYVVVHRVLRRPALTWITLPLIVVVTGWWLHRAAAASNGTVSQFNELHIVDLDARTGTLRGRTDVALYATDSTRVDLSVTPKGGSQWGAADANPEPHLAWLAPPETTLGGTFRASSGGLFHPEYVVSAPEGAAHARGVPMLVWASRHFETTWQAADAGALVEADLQSASMSRLSGTINHRLSGPLTNVLVAFGKWILIARPGVEWYPGEPIELESADFDRQELNAYLTRKTTTHVERKPGEGGEDYIVSAAAYDPFSTDVARTLSMLTFHAAAGGPGYTGLSNTMRAADDLSAQLNAGRAVVLGRLDEPASAVELRSGSGEPFELSRRATFVRFVLPIGRTDAGLPTTLAPLAPTENSDTPRPPRP